MQRYIEQLIEDIHKATWNLKPPHKLWEESGADPNDELEQEDMSYVEQYIEGESQTITQITGIEPGKLPPPELLTTEQQAHLAPELENLLQCFHFVLDFPEKFPSHLRYPFIRNFWNEMHVPLSFGESHIEFCYYEEENCPFPGYCTSCQDLKEEMKSTEKLDNKEDVTDIDVENLLMSAKEMEDFFMRKCNWRDQDDDNDDDEKNGVPPNSDLPF